MFCHRVFAKASMFDRLERAFIAIVDQLVRAIKLKKTAQVAGYLDQDIGTVGRQFEARNRGLHGTHSPGHQIKDAGHLLLRGQLRLGPERVDETSNIYAVDIGLLIRVVLDSLLDRCLGRPAQIHRNRKVRIIVQRRRNRYRV